MSQITRVVKQSRYQSHHGPVGAEPFAGLHCLFVTCQQAGHGQAHVKGVLDVVVGGFNAVVVMMFAVEQLFEVVKRQPDGIERRGGV